MWTHGVGCITATELSARLNVLEAENARLAAEMQSLRREKEMRDAEEKERREKERMEKLSKQNQRNAKDSPVYLGSRSPYSSPSNSFITSTTAEELKQVEESYQQRILKLEVQLEETYRLASRADQAREMAEKKVQMPPYLRY